MVWGGFGPVRIATLIFAAAALVGLYFLLKNKSRRTQTWVLGSLSFLGVAAILYNLLMWDAPLSYLPLHLCSFNALALPIVVFSRNKTMGNLLLVWSLGALAAVALPFEMTEAKLLSWPFFFFFFPHVVEFGIPILLFKLGHIKKDPKCIVSTVAITMAAYTFSHLMNKLINGLQLLDRDGDLITVNYMFSIEPTNPLVELFYKVIPYEYWHMYMVIPILVVYLLAVYSPQLCSAYRSRKAVKAK